MKNILKRQGKIIDKIFEIGILIKTFFGFFEILGGIILGISGKLIMNNFIIDLAQQEIAEDPHDLIANSLIKMAQNLSSDSHIFAILYLVLHGVINIFLAVGLLKNKIWAYPWAMSFYGIFMIYQVYRYLHTYSILLLILTLFDAFVVSAIWLEYKKHKIKS